jgi:hypothetical protein
MTIDPRAMMGRDVERNLSPENVGNVLNLGLRTLARNIGQYQGSVSTPSLSLSDFPVLQ